MGLASNLNIKGKRGENIIFFSPFLVIFGQWVALERNERKSFFSVRSMEIGWSEFVELRFKVHLLNEGYAWVPTTRNFVEDFVFREEKLERETLTSL